MHPFRSAYRVAFQRPTHLRPARPRHGNISVHFSSPAAGHRSTAQDSTGQSTPVPCATHHPSTQPASGPRPSTPQFLVSHIFNHRARTRMRGVHTYILTYARRRALSPALCMYNRRTIPYVPYHIIISYVFPPILERSCMFLTTWSVSQSGGRDLFFLYLP